MKERNRTIKANFFSGKKENRGLTRQTKKIDLIELSKFQKKEGIKLDTKNVMSSNKDMIKTIEAFNNQKSI